MRSGETLYSIARNYGVAYEDLMKENAITDPRRIRAGQRIRIPRTPVPAGTPPPAQKPPAITHRVARGETFFGIAGRYGTTVAELRAVNSLTERHLLKEGEVLLIPPGASKLPTPITGSPTAPGPSTTATASPAAIPPNRLDDPRTTIARPVDPTLRWPINAKNIAYMTGKLYGVVILGERSESVRSLTPGTVISAGPYRGFGRVVIVQGPGGYVYVYGGCETLSVKEGDRVLPGSELGKLGVDALSGRPKLFLLVYNDNVAVDPALAPRS